MLAIIDGDVLIHRSVDSDWWARLKLKDTSKPVVWTNEERRAVTEKGWDTFYAGFNEMLDRVYATDYLMAIKGKDNFRDTLFPEYKGNRKKDPNKINPFLQTIRDLTVMNELAVEADGMEADDLVRIWAEEARRSEVPYIVCSVDKDLNCISGKHFSMYDNKVYDVSENEAIYNYYKQLLTGDRTDNIPGLPKVGPVKAGLLLEGLSTEEEMQEVVVASYIEAFGDSWLDYLLSNGKLLHILRNTEDFFKVTNWKIVKALL